VIDPRRFVGAAARSVGLLLAVVIVACALANTGSSVPAATTTTTPSVTIYGYDQVLHNAQVARTGAAHGFVRMDSRAPTIPATPSANQRLADFVAAEEGLGDAATTAARIHGNSANSPATSYLYRLTNSRTGEYLKTGISKNPFSRYSGPFMQDKEMELLTSGSRREMLNLERFIVERDPGPLNREPWAGRFANDVPGAP
jgi:hypothetical protein